MYDEEPTNKLLAFISKFLSEYLVWLVVIGITIVWFFYPDLMVQYGQIIMFLAPVIVLFFGLIIILTRTKLRTKHDENRGVTQYDIIITKSTLYLVEFLIYGGALVILFIPIMLKNEVDLIDLFQAIVFFIFGNWLKQSFYNKMLK